MANTKDHAAECLCGRLRTRVHCPECGSAYIQAYGKREKAHRANGELVELKAYWCRRCGERFNEDRWQTNCQAPPRMPARRHSKLAVNVNTIEERAQLLEHLREIQKLRDLP